MNKTILLIAAISCLSGCTKDNSTVTIVDPPVSVDSTIYAESLQDYSFSFDKSKTVKFSTVITGNPVYYISVDNAIAGSTVQYTTPCHNMTGFEVRTVENAVFNKKDEGADYSVKNTSDTLIVTYKYIGFINGKHTFEWYDAQH